MCEMVLLRQCKVEELIIDQDIGCVEYLAATSDILV